MNTEFNRIYDLIDDVKQLEEKITSSLDKTIELLLKKIEITDDKTNEFLYKILITHISTINNDFLLPFDVICNELNEINGVDIIDFTDVL